MVTPWKLFTESMFDWIRSYKIMLPAIHNKVSAAYLFPVNKLRDHSYFLQTLWSLLWKVYLVKCHLNSSRPCLQARSPSRTAVLQPPSHCLFYTLTTIREIISQAQNWNTPFQNLSSQHYTSLLPLSKASTCNLRWWKCSPDPFF